MQTIQRVHGLEILDSRGYPTVRATVIADNGVYASASVPSGASCGVFEAHELRDNDPKRYHGKGVLQAVNNINETIHQALEGQSLKDPKKIDYQLTELDGTENRSKLGANAILAVSLATYRLAAKLAQQPLYEFLAPNNDYTLPVPMMNILNGGAHADNNVDIQEFMIMPIGASNFAEAMRMGAETFYTLKAILKEKKLATGVGDEGGFAPMLASNGEALDLIMLAIERAGFTPGKDIALALDLASSHFYQDGHYCLTSENKKMTAADFVAYLNEWLNNYPIVSMEDPIDEVDHEGWSMITHELGNRVQIVGDDVFVTQKARLQQGIKQRMANAILIKPNQVGTVTETLETIELAKKFGYRTVTSHRSGETEDPFIADLAVGLNTGQIKTGSLCRSERMAKYNRLLQIESQLKDKATYCGNLFI